METPIEKEGLGRSAAWPSIPNGGGFAPGRRGPMGWRDARGCGVLLAALLGASMVSAGAIKAPADINAHATTSLSQTAPFDDDRCNAPRGIADSSRDRLLQHTTVFANVRAELLPPSANPSGPFAPDAGAQPMTEANEAAFPVEAGQARALSSTTVRRISLLRATGI